MSLILRTHLRPVLPLLFFPQLKDLGRWGWEYSPVGSSPSNMQPLHGDQYLLMILTLTRLRQKDQKFQVISCYSKLEVSLGCVRQWFPNINKRINTFLSSRVPWVKPMHVYTLPMNCTYPVLSPAYGGTFKYCKTLSQQNAVRFGIHSSVSVKMQGVRSIPTESLLQFSPQLLLLPTNSGRHGLDLGFYHSALSEMSYARNHLRHLEPSRAGHACYPPRLLRVPILPL